MNNNFVLKNGHLFVLAEAAGGVYNCDQLKKISELAEEDSAILKITEDQRIGFIINKSRFASVQKSLAAHGIILQHYRGSGVIAPKACLGELCPLAQQDALGDAVELEAALMGIFPEPKTWLSIGLNGCEKACIGSALDDIHIVGEETGYKIAIAGRTREFPQLGQFLCDNVTQDKLVETVKKIIDVYFENQEQDERLCDVVERVGMSVFMAATDSSMITETPAVSSSDVEISDVEISDTEIDLLDDDVSIQEQAMDAPAQEDTMDVTVQEDSLDVPIQEDKLDIPLQEEELLDIKIPKEDELDLDEMEEITDMSTGSDVIEEEDLSLDDSAEAESTEVDVDEELRTTIANNTQLTKNLNAEIDADLTPDLGDEELMLDDDVQLSLKATEAVALEDDDTEQEINDVDVVSVDTEAFITEDSTDLMDYEEATQDDVKRMTNALRSESSRGTAQSVVSEEKIPKPVSEVKAEAISPPAPLNKIDNNVAPTGRLKLKMGATEVKIILPSGVECAIPLDWINSCGSFEMDIESQTLIIEKQGNMLKLQYGTLVLSVPMMLPSLSAA